MPELPVGKVWWKSKSMIVSFLTAVAGVVGFFVPGVAEWVASHNAAILSGLGVLGMILRVITKDALVLEE